MLLTGLLLATRVSPAAAGEATGEGLYRRHCAPCHGPTGRGDGPDASLFVNRPRDLRESFLNKYPTAELVERVRAGVPLELAVDLPALRARATDVEAVVSYMKQLPTIDWPRIEIGREIYVDRCEVCHGPYGRPPAVLPPGVARPGDLTPEQLQGLTSPPMLLELVRRGHEAMPALVPRVPEADGPPLAAFLRLMSPGFESWDRNCATCHGDDGRGEGTLADALRMPKIVLDAAYFRSHDPEQLRAGAWHMLAQQKPTMPHFRWTITTAQAAAIVDYLKRTDTPPPRRR